MATLHSHFVKNKQWKESSDFEDSDRKKPDKMAKAELNAKLNTFLKESKTFDPKLIATVLRETAENLDPSTDNDDSEDENNNS